MEHAPLSIRLLGEIEVRFGERALVFPASRKTRALLGFLVAARGEHRRDRLCSLLWEGPDDPRAQLRWSLAKLRPLLDSGGAVRLWADREHVRFDGAGVEVDLWEVESESPSLAGVPVERLRSLEERTRGELMDGLDLPDAYRFQQWLVAAREGARARRVAVLRELLARLAAGEPQEALAYARTWVQAEPFSDAAHAAVVRLLGTLGRRREALDHYDAVRVVFKRETGSALSGELEEARRAVSAAVRSAPTGGEAPPPRPPAMTAPAPEAVPFVGRSDLLSTLEAWAAESSGSPGFLLLIGEPGVGKTRLLSRLAARFAGRGEVISGRAFLAERVRPFGSFVDALRTLPEGAVPGAVRQDLSGLLPELGPSAASGDERRQLQGVVELLSHRVATRGALLLGLDDAHWLDEATAGLLHYLSRSTRLGGLLVALTARGGELSENVPVSGLVRALGSEGKLFEVLVPPMNEDEVACLVASSAPGVDPRRVFTESEGNPLVALEVADALARGVAVVSRSYEERLRDRFERLSPAARQLLPWAAALGRTFPVDVLASASGLASASLLGALQELVDRGLVRPVPGGFDFSHDLVRRAAYRQLAEPALPLLHREIARALAARPDPDGLVAAEVARHAVLGGEGELAGRAARAAAERCLRLFARREAAELADLGLAAVRSLPPAVRLPLQLGLLDVHVQAAKRPASALADELSRAVAEAADFPALVARGYFLLAVLHHDGGRSSGAESAVLRATEASRHADAGTRCFTHANAGRCLLMLERDVPRARRELLEARGLADAHGVSNAELPMGLGLDALFRGEHDEAVSWLEEGLSIATREKDHWRECIFLSRLARLELERDRPGAARERCEVLRPVAGKMGESAEGPICDALTAVAEYGLGRPGAVEKLEHALAALREVDTKADLAFVQDLAAEIELGERPGPYVAPACSPRPLGSARRRAQEALGAAEAMGLRSEETIARALLARLAWIEGNVTGAAGLVASLEPELARVDALSARAGAALARSLAARRVQGA